MKAVLIEIVNCLRDTAASLDAMEAELISNGILKNNSIANRFNVHKEIVESHLMSLRSMIDSLPY
jgi:hypothetical protein